MYLLCVHLLREPARCDHCVQVNVPVGKVDGAPIGLGLIGPPGSDEQLLEVAVRVAAVLSS